MASKIINYLGNEKIYNVENINELLSQKQDKLVIDKALANSKNPVENQAILKAITAEKNAREAAIVTIENKIGDISLLETDTKENTVAAINELHAEVNYLATGYDTDDVPTEGSTRVSKSGGTFNAIRFASVKIGEVMLWPQISETTLFTRSDEKVTFTFNNKQVTVIPKQEEIGYCKMENIPDGWHACDGSAKLLCNDYPELAKFFGGTQNADGTWNNDGHNTSDNWVDNKSINAKVWIPYCPMHIIKVAY